MLMIGKQLSAEQRLTKAVVDIMASPKYVALAGVLMVGKREISDAIPTACTNGRDELYGRAFVESLSDAELRFLVLHECYHKLYKHLTTWRHLYDECAPLANIACDFVINLKISDDNKDGFAVMPSKNGKAVGAIDPKYRGMDSAQVYNLLKQEHGGSSGGDNSSGEGSGTGIGEGEGLDSHDWEGAQDLTVEEKQALARDIDEAIRQGALIAGKLGTGGDRAFDDLLKTHAMLLRMDSLSPKGERYRELAYRIFYTAPAELRNHGFRLPVRVDTAGMPSSIASLLADGPFLPMKDGASLCVVRSLPDSGSSGEVKLSFSCPGNPAKDRIVGDVVPAALVNKLSDALFREEVPNGSDS